MLSRRIIMTVIAPAALALAFAACAAQAQSSGAAEDHHKRGLALGNRGELDRAIAEYDKAIKYGAESSARNSSVSYLVSASNPVLAMAYNNRGIAHRDNGDMKRALADFS